jgi:hypothetical protein
MAVISGPAHAVNVNRMAIAAKQLIPRVFMVFSSSGK